VCASLLFWLTLQGSAVVCAARAADSARDPPSSTVTVILSEYRFTSAHLVFHRGSAYRLLLENRGKELHEFTAPAFLHAISVRTPAVLGAGGREIVLQPGEHKELDFVASTAGRYALSCADHDWAGMTGSIVVK
jgi:uncharacterized cupredoxin-like copper-binding protein